MSASMIVVPKNHHFVVWFDLHESHRCLGVRFKDDEPVDVFCDHP